MDDDFSRTIEQDQETTKRAECFARAVLGGLKDDHARDLLEFAERAAQRTPMHWEKTIVWLSLALRADRVDEATLTGIGFDDQEVRHATIVRNRPGESTTEYAKRIAAYNEPEAISVAEALLDEPADTNPTVPPETTDTARRKTIDHLRHAFTLWTQRRPGERPPAGGVADSRQTAPGLADAVRRLEHHVQMIGLSLKEMRQGPAGTPWGIAERLSFEDLEAFLDAASLLTFHATAIVMETSNVTPTPATDEERLKLVGTRKPGTRHLAGIAAAASTLYEVATRIECEVPLRTASKRIH